MALASTPPYEVTLKETILRGDTWEGKNFVVTRAGVDYTDPGVVVRAQVRKLPDLTVLIDKTIAPNSVAVGEIDFDFKLTAAETALLEDAKAQADIEITTPNDVKTPILIIFTVIKDTTK